MKFIITFLILLSAFGCTQNVSSSNAIENNSIDRVTEALVDSLNGDYKEWYSGKTQLKYTGGLDSQGRRHGRWIHYLESGVEKSMTTYTHGMREGFSIVKYDTGMLFYRGEWRKDKKVGVWTTYDSNGKVKTEMNYSSEIE